MFACFIEGCEKVFTVSSNYIKHLNSSHKIPVNYRYVCTFTDCIQKTNNWYTFKRHCLRHDTNTGACANTNSGGESSSVPNVHQIVDEISNNVPHFDCSAGPSNTPQSTSPLTNHLRDINEAAVAFTLELHNETNIPRSDVITIQRKASELNTNIVKRVEEVLDSVLTGDENPQSKFELSKYLERLKQPFDFIDTDYKFFKYIENLDIFRFPTTVVLKNDETLSKPQQYQETENVKGQIVLLDIEHQLKSYFYSDGVLQKTIANTIALEKQSSISNIVNANVWKTIKKRYPGDVLIPVSIYSDEFEVNDCLSSHNKKHVICGIYYSIPTIPDQYRSKLCNIFVAGMIRKVEINEVGISKLFNEVIQKFKRIEEKGTTFIIEDKAISVRFVLSIVQGDNLGLHQMHQFMTFSANFYCRFCSRSRDQCQTDTEEQLEYRRTIETYNNDVKTNRPSETGVRGPSIFNQLPCFHVVENLYVDAMHDFFSGGICTLGFTAILNYCIYVKKFISLSAFNTQKTMISKTVLDTSLSRMPDLTECFVPQTKSKSIVIRATASELKSFAHYFTFILGPFVPQSDAVWQFCKTLVKITDKILMPTFNDIELEELRQLCSEHHRQYQILFKLHLKPKQHFLCHYKSVILMSGSVSSLMNYRYEAKHKTFKEYAGVISSRKNICYTLCMKAALQFSHDVFHKEFFKDSLEGTFKPCCLEDKHYAKSLPRPLPFGVDQNMRETTQIKYKGTVFKTGTYVTITQHLNVDLLEIIDILVSGSSVFLVGLRWVVGQFDEHFLAYKLIDKTDKYCIYSIDYIDGPPIKPLCINNRWYFRKKHDFNSMEV